MSLSFTRKGDALRRGVLAITLAAVAVTGYRWVTSEDAPAVRAPGLALDRLWIDHLPRDERDAVEVFVALDEAAIGVFSRLSQWRGAHEAFRFEAQGDALRIHYPHTDQRERVSARARPCQTGGFDYCLELAGASRGVKRYYSLEGWEIERASDVDALAAQVRAHLAAARRRQAGSRATASR